MRKSADFCIFIFTIKGPEDSEKSVAIIFGMYAYT